jgi:hypothetical protein
VDTSCACLQCCLTFATQTSAALTIIVDSKNLCFLAAAAPTVAEHSTTQQQPKA